MDRLFDWVTANAPWLLPLAFVLSLTFLVVPTAARNGYNSIIGEDPRFVTNSRTKIMPGGPTAGENPNDPVGASSPASDRSRAAEGSEGGPEFKPATDFSEAEENPRLGLWASVLSAALGLTDWVCWLVLLLAAFSAATAAMSYFKGTLSCLPDALILGLIGVSCLAFVGMVMFWWAPWFTTPQAIEGIAERLLTPSELEHTAKELGTRGRDHFTQLYSWLHGVDPTTGRVTSTPDWSRLAEVRGYFNRLALVTFASFWFLVVLCSLTAMAIRRGAPNPSHPGTFVFALAMVMALLTHGVQWFWLADSFGRLCVAPRELKSMASTSTDAWPFSQFKAGIECRREIRVDGNLEFCVANPWPLDGPGTSGIRVAVTTPQDRKRPNGNVPRRRFKRGIGETCPEGWLAGTLPLDGQGINVGQNRVSFYDGNQESTSCMNEHMSDEVPSVTIAEWNGGLP